MNRELNSFLKNLRAHEKKVLEQDIPRFYIAVYGELFRRIVLKTPVDTGRARGNWQIELSRNISRTKPKSQWLNVVAIGEERLQKLLHKKVPRIAIINNVPYIEYLEKGTSKQAPQGMIAVSIAEVNQAFR